MSLGDSNDPGWTGYDQKLAERIARAIADDQGEAYAEHMSEYDSYGRVAATAIGTSQAEIERLRKALEFYANPEIYKPHPEGPAFDRRDVSYVARSALEGK